MADPDEPIRRFGVITMSKHSATHVAVGVAVLLAAMTCTRSRSSPLAVDAVRGLATPTAEHVRAVGKSLVTDDLICGRLTLAEAAARFRALEQLPELRGSSAGDSAYVRPGPWSNDPPTTKLDRLYLRVLACVEARLEHVPSVTSARVFARLEQEYRELHSPGHPLTVPDLVPLRREAYLAEVRLATLRAASGQQQVRGPSR
jgi:hypothetical protein